MEDVFCLMPWIHLHVDTSGKVKACCNSSITYGDVNQNSLAEIWNGKNINQFRDQLKQGIPDKRCSVCYKKEAVGKESVRTETLAKYQQHIESAKNGTIKQPVYLDIRFSNICNLKCRTCWHGASSSWFEEAKILKNNFGDKAIIKATTDNQQLIDDVFSFSSIEEAYFAGGEPLMMEEHFLFLEQLISNNQKDAFLRYNTNLSQLKLKNYHIIEYWKQFSKVHLSVSIDNLFEKAEYIRKGLKWSVFMQNIQQIKAECPHVQIEIAPTISIFNILDLPEIHQYFVQENLISVNNIYLNLLDRPAFQNIRILPLATKEKVQKLYTNHIKWLLENKASSVLIKEFESLLHYMYSKDESEQIKAFIQHTNKLDKLRTEHFNEIFPELYEEIII